MKSLVVALALVLSVSPALAKKKTAVASDPKVAALEDEIRRHNALYWDEDKPEITDAAYDVLVTQLKAIAPDSPLLEALGPSRSFGAPF